MSTFTDAERDAQDLAKLVNEDTDVTTRYGTNPKKSAPKAIREFTENSDLALKNSNFTDAGFDFTTGGTIETYNQLVKDSNGNSWQWQGDLPYTVAPATVPSNPDWQQRTFNEAVNVSKDGGGSVQDFIDSYESINYTYGDLSDAASIITGSSGSMPSSDPNPTRAAWDAISNPPTVSANSLGLTGHYIEPTVGAAYLFSGTSGYYSYIKGVLSITNGGDNANDQLAGVCYGYHCDVVNGSHCGVFGGSFAQVEGNYSGSVLGTQKQIWALDSVTIGGRNIKMGDPLDLNALKRSFALGGQFNEMPKGEQSGILGGEQNKNSGDNSLILGGLLNEIPEGYSDVTVNGAGVIADASRCNIYSNGQFTALGDNQVYDIGAHRKAAGTTVAYLSRTGASSGDIYTPPANSLVTIDFTVSVMRTDVLGDTACFKITATFTNVSGSLVMSGESITEVYNPSGYSLSAQVRGGGANVGLRVLAPSAQDMRCSSFGKMTVQRVV